MGFIRFSVHFVWRQFAEFVKKWRLPFREKLFVPSSCLSQCPQIGLACQIYHWEHPDSSFIISELNKLNISEHISTTYTTGCYKYDEYLPDWASNDNKTQYKLTIIKRQYRRIFWILSLIEFVTALRYYCYRLLQKIPS